MSIPTWVIWAIAIVAVVWVLAWDDARRRKREEREKEIEVARRFVRGIVTATRVVKHEAPAIDPPLARNGTKHD